jgi:hypothetical protein
MPDIEITSRVHESGPIFDGRARRYVDLWADDVEEEVAHEANQRLHSELHAVLRHPTGYYESHVRAERIGPDWRVTDGGVVYGPWLEGTGSRNKTTRFKGYFHWRRVKSSIDRDAPDIARRMLPRLERRLS